MANGFDFSRKLRSSLFKIFLSALPVPFLHFSDYYWVRKMRSIWLSLSLEIDDLHRGGFCARITSSSLLHGPAFDRDIFLC